MPRKFSKEPNEKEDEGRAKDTGPSVLDALGDKVVPSSESLVDYLDKKKADASYPPQPGQMGTPMQQGGEPQVYNPQAVEDQLGGNSPVDQMYKYHIQQGANPQEALSKAKEMEQQVAQRAQQGAATENIFQLGASVNPLAQILDSDEGFVPVSHVKRVAKLLK